MEIHSNSFYEDNGCLLSQDFKLNVDVRYLTYSKSLKSRLNRKI